MIPASKLAIGLGLFALPLCSVALAADSTRPVEGISDHAPQYLVLRDARIVPAPGEVIERGRIVIRDGEIIAVDAREDIPEGAAVRELGGKTVFYGLIEPVSQLGVPKALREGASEPVDADASAGPRHWNPRVRPERQLVSQLQIDEDELKMLRAEGFALAHAVPGRGIWRGQGALLALSDDSQPGQRVRIAATSQLAAFETGQPFGGEYPGSLMGAIALVRQSLLDARWYAQPGLDARQQEANLALPVLGAVLAGQQGVWWRTQDELDPGRVRALNTEFELRSVLVGNGHEYRLLPSLKSSGMPVIAPLKFPDAPKAHSQAELLALSLAQLQHWEQAPANPGRLSKAGITLALTSAGLDKPADFWPALRRAVQAGLSEDAALAALTTVPAELLGQAQRLGRIAPGYAAHLLVADAGLFREAAAKPYQVYVDGVLHELRPLVDAAPLGRWQLVRGAGLPNTELLVEDEGSLKVKLGDESAKADWQAPLLQFVAPAGWFGSAHPQPISLRLEGELLRGQRSDAGGQGLPISATRLAEGTSKSKDDKPAEPIPTLRGYPAGAYAMEQAPIQPETLLIRGATVWTQGPRGVLENADVLVRRGRIVEVGQDLRAPSGAEVIEAAGLHLTPGLVDAHSHTAVARNVNEPSHAVTTEVRIGDALDPTDISIYRQLASGVTTVLALHGSANPMGGQSATLKWRWGGDAEGLKFDGAKPGVKFALGENVKQSNWGDGFTSRYPQTRMGVETLMQDRFNAARAYAAEQAAYAKRPRGPAPRRDLRLEALAEILAGERLVHIHSYRQDEILMFARLSQLHGFRVGSFTHILEGYKVADVLAEIGAGASTFADWWAFKMEVYDAIPYNAALMHRQGVLTSLNSDSDELARRLNTEAAKAVKYGGVSPTEALAMVTLNPARQIGVADRVGSIEPDKDADLTLWNASPLSSFARVERTLIDGRTYYSREQDARLRDRDSAERNRLLGKLLATPVAPGPNASEEPGKTENSHWPQQQHAAYRGLYHHGSDIVGCSVADHNH